MTGGLARPAIAVFLLLGGPARAADAPDLVENDAEKLGLVRKIVVPKLNQVERDQARGGFVDVHARLTPWGTLLDATLDADRPETNVVLEPLREVLPRWRFRTPADADCKPVHEPVHFRILFEGGRIQTQMRVMHEKAPMRPNDDGMRITHYEESSYPRSMLRKGTGGVTFSRAEVAPDGHVTRVVSLPFAEGLTESELKELGRASSLAVLKWRFTPSKEGAQEPRTACETFYYQVLH